MSGIKHFSGFEVIRAAKEVEKNGHRFYSTMSERASDPSLKDIFTGRAQDEVEHLRRWNQVESRYQDGSCADCEEEFLQYLNRFADDQIFPDAECLEAVLNTQNADLQALDMAIEAEVKFAEYFAKASSLAQSDDGREAFDWLAGEESRHAKILQERRAKYSAS
ncbi:MAG: ferritin family protein [Deltaproteobacteria bacterium]|jgi:rubrerythrin|nr:ferritin family protein [Deltaproteobacteria bacterium]